MKLGMGMPLTFLGAKTGAVAAVWLARWWPDGGGWTPDCGREAGCDCDLSELLEAGAPLSVVPLDLCSGRRKSCPVPLTVAGEDGYVP